MLLHNLRIGHLTFCISQTMKLLLVSTLYMEIKRYMEKGSEIIEATLENVKMYMLTSSNKLILLSKQMYASIYPFCSFFIVSSPELKAQVSYSNHLLSVCLSVSKLLHF
jgi:hypothetical protein